MKIANGYIERDVTHSGWRYVGHGCWQCLNCFDDIFQPTELEFIQCPRCGANIGGVVNEQQTILECII